MLDTYYKLKDEIEEVYDNHYRTYDTYLEEIRELLAKHGLLFEIEEDWNYPMRWTSNCVKITIDLGNLIEMYIHIELDEEEIEEMMEYSSITYHYTEYIDFLNDERVR